MNSNLRLAQCFVDELAQSGVRHACISPGSRSTPLTLAFYNQPDIHVHLLIDERSAAFFALGLSLATGMPAPLVCTSGSAAANYFPAIVEARMANIPLLILTADRPHELRGSGANQAIDQVKLYGDMVLLFVEMPLPESQPGDLVDRHVRTLAARSLAAANGLSKGPVHLNFPFRKPLQPASPDEMPLAERASDRPFTRITRGAIAPTPAQVADVGAAVRSHPSGLIVCGPQSCVPPGFAAGVHALSQAAGYPILADPLSGLRFDACAPSPWRVGAYDALLAANSPACPAPDLVLRFGAVPTSAPLGAFLDRHHPVQVLINEDGGWADDTHRLSALIQADPVLLLAQVTAELAQTGQARHSPDLAYARAWERLEQAAWQELARQVAERPLFDAAIIPLTLSRLPQSARLFVGNSLAIRHFDRFAAPRPAAWQVFGSRGASGIDGNLSTVFGIAAADPQQPVVIFTGDLAVLHDLNALHLPQLFGLSQVTIVVNNNHGGGIFHRLPVQAFEPPFTEAFLTPHDLTFEKPAATFGLDYTLAASSTDLKAALQRRFASPSTRPALIEVSTDSAADANHNQQILQALASRLEI